MISDDVMPSLIDAGFGVLLRDINPAERPEVLFHFTTVAGLMGIADGRSLWASLATSLNDSSEVLFAVKLAADLIDKHQVPAPEVFAQHIRYYLDPDNSPDQARIRWYPFVTSFCGRADSVTHWLHYGHSGTGVAVGFDSQKLVQPPFELVKIIYEYQQQLDFLSSIIAAITSKFEELRPGATENDQDPFFRAAAHLTAQAIWASSPRLKASAFAAEEEWRLITYETEGVDFAGAPGHVDLPTRHRVTGTRLVAYKEVRCDPAPITEVILGASCDTGPDDYALSQLLPGVASTRSAVPVRP